MSVIAVLGAGMIGETLISGLRRSGWSGDRLIATERRPERAAELAEKYGIRPEEQRRLSGAGEKMRVYVPYGHEWYGYLMRRLAERPSNVTFFLRSLVSQS